MSCQLPIKRGDTRTWTFNLTEGGTAVDLTGATIKVFMRLAPITTVSNKIDGTAASISGDPTLGVVTYDPVATDVDTVGDYLLELQVTFGTVLATFPSDGWFTVTIYEDLGD